jgi:copper(I)-binding protein
MRRFGILVVALTMTSTTALAQSAGSIRVEDAWARQAPAMHGRGHGPAGNGAVYVTIRNGGGQPDALVAAASDAAATVELHETVRDGGVMRMRPLEKVTVPAGGAVEMKPGGHHIMLLGLRRDLRSGDTVTVTLTFEKAGTVSVQAPVR